MNITDHQRIIAAATSFVQEHLEDYELLKTSHSMDVDVEFMALCDAVMDSAKVHHASQTIDNER